MNIIKANNLLSSDSYIAIIVARFNEFINNSLMKGAIDTLKCFGQIKDENITVIWVPGAYELPLASSAAAKTGKYQAVIALATIIRGDTDHFQYISNSVSNTLSCISYNMEIPVSFGVLTTQNVQQAIERSGVKKNNKGVEAALAALEMINILKMIKT